MKKILITGANSYIGTSFEKWLQKYSDRYIVETVEMVDGRWRDKLFNGYDALFHVAGIAHIKETKENAYIYDKINRDLVLEVAQKAKNEGVKQFLFLSSMSVYGIENGIIDRNSPLNPTNSYGKSKLQAEELITLLEDDFFKIAIIRPPMVYGKGCKGNYPRLAMLATRLPFFPNIKNKRSMLYVDNLCEFARLLIDDCASGLFLPQNEEYVCTAEMVKIIAETHGKRVRMTRILNTLLRLARSNTLNKVFGDLVYEKSLSDYSDAQRYSLIGFKESIKLTEE